MDEFHPKRYIEAWTLGAALAFLFGCCSRREATTAGLAISLHCESPTKHAETTLKALEC